MLTWIVYPYNNDKLVYFLIDLKFYIIAVSELWSQEYNISYYFIGYNHVHSIRDKITDVQNN